MNALPFRALRRLPRPPPTTSRSYSLNCAPACTSRVQCPLSVRQTARPPGQQRNATTSSTAWNKREVGTKDQPLEMGYYDILDVPVKATTDEIKKAYHRLVLVHHPDRNPGDRRAAERFNEITVAYQTLADEELRQRYNMYGAKGDGEFDQGAADAQSAFIELFGGRRFVPIIGKIDLAMNMTFGYQNGEEDINKKKPKAAKGSKHLVLKDDDAEEQARLAAEKLAKHKKRVKKLVKNLERKIRFFTKSATGDEQMDMTITHFWREKCVAEAEDLKHESYGVALLREIGAAYTRSAEHYLATTRPPFGLGGWLHYAQGKYREVTETSATLLAGRELKMVLEKLSFANKRQDEAPTPERQQRILELSNECVSIQLRLTKLEIQHIVRETCDMVLGDPSLLEHKAKMSALALQIIGQEYTNVKLDKKPSTNEYQAETQTSAG